MLQNKKIELLAPVGTADSFHAALDAGADAVYLGFGDFNARQRSKNFSPAQLSFLIPHAQSLGKKVYITLNTLVKDGEIPAFVNDCNALKELKPDAVIVQDLGMAALIKEYFPKFEMHGSTQMSIHNSLGFKAAEKLGLKRVVPARELTLQEIRKLNNKTPLEIELFVHGALCYAVSGNCMASSFIGGASGNRGKCTQVCRRKFSEGGTRSGFYFSPKDFWAIDFIDEYRNIGITSLKIEGRMKGPEYTYGVTSAYREYLDGTIDLETAKERLSHDFGRQKCTFLLNGEGSTGIVSAGRPAGTGNFAGKVMGVMRNEIVVDHTGDEIEKGDRVRFHSHDGSEGEATKVISVVRDESMTRIEVTSSEGFKRDGSLFIISRPSPMTKEWHKRRTTVAPRLIKSKKIVPSGRVMAAIDSMKSAPAKANELFIRVDTFDWLRLAVTRKDATLILNLDHEMEIEPETSLLTRLAPRLIISLPVFIPETEVSFWKDQVAKLKKMGVRQFMVAQYGIKELFTPQDVLYADYPVWSVNRWTQKMLLEGGFKGFTYSPEDDILNLKRTGNKSGLMPIFMRIPLFLSRVNSPVQDGHTVEDDRKEEYLTFKKKHLSNLISKQPLGLTHRTTKLREYGISKFVVDFSWYEQDSSLFRSVLHAYDNEKRVEGSALFNHKSGLL